MVPFARERHQTRGPFARERQQAGRVLGREAGAVDEQVGALPERLGQLGGVPTVGRDEPRAGRGEVGREVGRIATRQVDVPAGGFYSFCSYVAPDGELRGAFVGRKLEQYPERFGTGCLVIGEQVSEIVERGSAILKAFGYQGISEVEFIWDPTRKEHLLLDVNPRVWKWIGLPIASGVDLPWLAYSEAIGQPARASEPRDGLRWNYERDYATGEVVSAVWDPDDPGPFAQLLLNEGPAGRYYCAC